MSGLCPSPTLGKPSPVGIQADRHKLFAREPLAVSRNRLPDTGRDAKQYELTWQGSTPVH
jgi:hypothetical protein